MTAKENEGRRPKMSVAKSGLNSPLWTLPFDFNNSALYCMGL